MTSGTSCTRGRVECDYSETHEMPLVERILRTIDQYHTAEQAEPCPACLRDAILAVAALLHLRAAGPIHTATGRHEAEFGEAASESLRAVTLTVSGGAAGFKQ